jgi:hypothetical protein
VKQTSEQRKAYEVAYRAANADRIARRRRRRYDERRAVLAMVKSTRGCAECGRTGPHSRLHFDHIDPDTKSFDVSGATRTWPTILAELAKCEVRCAECHMARTVREGHAWRNRERVGPDEARRRKQESDRRYQRRRRADPAYRERKAEDERRRWATDPAYRERVYARHRERLATDPAYRERVNELQSAGRRRRKSSAEAAA